MSWARLVEVCLLDVALQSFTTSTNFDLVRVGNKALGPEFFLLSSHAWPRCYYARLCPMRSRVELARSPEP